tara:strand:+ start:1071 stop:1283 length:213 start_codon:yes stop_codon:yes gene_type:complete
MIEFKKPRFWDFKKPNFIAHLLLPLTIPLIISNFLLGLKKKKERYKPKKNLYWKHLCWWHSKNAFNNKNI